MCKNEKQIEDFYKKYSECKNCNSKRGLEHYYDNKEIITDQRKLFYEKKIDYYRNKLIDIYILKNY